MKETGNEMNAMRQFTVSTVLSVVAAFGVGGLQAQEPIPEPPACGVNDPTSRTLPFTREENADGARFVWFSMCRAGLPYQYVLAADLPESSDFTEVDSTTPGGIQAGDLVWWPEFVAIVAGTDGPVATAGGPSPLEGLVERYGKPRFYRRLVPRGGDE